MRLWPVLLLLPLVGAGTPDEPEIQDPAGDATAPIGDVVAAWFEPTGHATVDVVVELVELRGQDSLRIDATWQITGPFDGAPESGFGARAWLTPSGDRAVQLRPDVSQGPNLEITRGAPATVRIQDVWTGGREWGGGTITDFEVRTVPASPTDGVASAVAPGEGPLDTAGPGRDLLLGLGGSAADTPWNITGTLRVESPAEEDIPGPVDLTGLWAGSNGTGFDLTARLRSMTPEEAAACETLRVFVFLGTATSDGVVVSGSASVTFQDGWAVRTFESFTADTRRDYDTVATEDFPYELRWTFGTPGFFQVHGRDVDVSLNNPSIRTHCGGLDDSLDEPYSFGQIFAEGAPFLLPVFFATIASIVGAMLVKRRNDRR